MDDAELKARLPAPIAARIRSLKLADGVATAVLDASGLDSGGRAELEDATRIALGNVKGVKGVRVGMMGDRVQRRIVAIGSGKGGVGKSTLTANLAVALARAGRKVGVVDADVYGPSQPTLLGTRGQKPTASGKQLHPVPSEFGIPMLSMGHLVEPGKALAWRGPMAGNALAQLVEADWGDTELLLVDLPPGTGDVQLTMLQRFKPVGAVIVSTPQDLALIDAARAIQLFEQADVPIIGMVENMAGYACPHCGEASDPFGQGGAEAAAIAMGTPFLGRIPLALDIRLASDAGRPPAATDDANGVPFAAIAAGIADWLDG